MFLSSLIGSKVRILLSVFAFVLVAGHDLQAFGCGKTDEVVSYEETIFNGVFVDVNGVYFTALIPEYSGTVMADGGVFINGKKIDGDWYTVITAINAQYTPPKTEAEFIKMVQKENKNTIVKRIDPKKYNAKYAVEVAPKDKKSVDFWRILSTKDRLILMSAPDANVNRRTKFFESISIR